MGSNSVTIINNNTRKSIPPGKVFTLRGGALNINIPGAALFFRENRRTAELFLFVI